MSIDTANLPVKVLPQESGKKSHETVLLCQSSHAIHGGASGLSIAQYNALAKTMLLFEVADNANGTDITDANPNDPSADNSNGDIGKSPAGWGIGSDYDPILCDLSDAIFHM